LKLPCNKIEIQLVNNAFPNSFKKMIMKKIALFIIGFFLFSIFSISQSLTVTVNFEKPIITETSDGFSEITLKNCFPMGEEGSPLLPLYGADVLLPQGQEILDIEIVSVTYSNELSGINIKPAGRQFPISKGGPEGYKAIPNAAIYSSGNRYPLNIIVNRIIFYLPHRLLSYRKQG
jgi:hypothetical protein